MLKKAHQTILILIFIVGLVSGKNNTYNIDSEFNGSESDGSENKPFKNIDSAFQTICSSPSNVGPGVVSTFLLTPKKQPYVLLLTNNSCANYSSFVITSNHKGDLDPTMPSLAQIELDSIWLPYYSSISFSSVWLVKSSQQIFFEAFIVSYFSNITIINSRISLDAHKSCIFFRAVYSSLLLKNCVIQHSNIGLLFSIADSQTQVEDVIIYSDNSSPIILFLSQPIKRELIQSKFDGLNITININSTGVESYENITSLYYFTFENTIVTLEDVSIQTMEGSLSPSLLNYQKLFSSKSTLPNLVYNLKNVNITDVSSSKNLIMFEETRSKSQISIDGLNIRNCYFDINKNQKGLAEDVISFKVWGANAQIKITNTFIQGLSDYNFNQTIQSEPKSIIKLNTKELSNSLIVSNFTLEASKITSSRVFKLEGQRLDFNFDTIKIQNCSIDQAVIYVERSFSRKDKVFSLLLSERKNSFRNIIINDASFESSFIFLRDIDLGWSKNSSFMAFDTVNIKIAQMHANNVKVGPTSNEKRLHQLASSFILTFNCGMKITDSSFKNFNLNQSSLISTLNYDSTIIVMNNLFEDFIGLSESHIFRANEERRGRLPEAFDASALCLVNNSFKGKMSFEESTFIIDLNILNYFIIGNRFEYASITAQGALLGTLNVLSNPLPATSLAKQKYLDLIKDPLIHSLYADYLQTDELGNPLFYSQFIIASNSFNDLVLRCRIIELQNEKKEQTKAFLNITNNKFFRINNDKIVQKTNNLNTFWRYDSLEYIKLIQMPFSVVEQNQAYDLLCPAMFLTILSNLQSGMNIIIKSNTAENNKEDFAAFNIKIAGYETFEISDNSISSCLCETRSLISIMTSSTLDKDLIITRNTFKTIILKKFNYKDIALFKIRLVENMNSNIKISKLFVKNVKTYANLNSELLGQESALIYVLSPLTRITIEESNFTDIIVASPATSLMSLIASKVEILRSCFKKYEGQSSQIRSFTTNLVINQSVFSDNQAFKGAALASYPLYDESSENKGTKISLLFCNNKFIRNFADFGGVLYISGNTRRVFHITFNNNTYMGDEIYRNMQGGLVWIQSVEIERLEISDSNIFISGCL